MTPPSIRGRKINKVNALMYALLIEAMLDGTYTSHELAELTGLHYTTVCDYTRALHKKGACYVDHYETDSTGRMSVKVYRIGRGKDAKLRRATSAERQAKTRAKRKAIRTIHMMAGAIA